MALYETADKVLSPIRAVLGSFVAAAAGDYADNDVISDSVSNGTGTAITFANAVRTPGGAGKIVGANVNFVASTAIGATCELELFSQTPTATELDDNAAAGTAGAADAPYYLGIIAFSAGTDYGAGTISRPTTLTPAAPLFIHAEGTSQSIFGRLIFRDAEANETAGMSVIVTLYIE
jgi:hypothetical protein